MTMPCDTRETCKVKAGCASAGNSFFRFEEKKTELTKLLKLDGEAMLGSR